MYFSITVKMENNPDEFSRVGIAPWRACGVGPIDDKQGSVP